MSAISDGGKAFPEPGVYDVINDRVNPVGSYYDAGGMSLRDYFAAKALASMLSGPTEIREGTPELAAKLSYRFADAMLAERSKAEGESK